MGKVYFTHAESFLKNFLYFSTFSRLRNRHKKPAKKSNNCFTFHAISISIST